MTLGRGSVGQSISFGPASPLPVGKVPKPNLMRTWFKSVLGALAIHLFWHCIRSSHIKQIQQVLWRRVGENQRNMGYPPSIFTPLSSCIAWCGWVDVGSGPEGTRRRRHLGMAKGREEGRGKRASGVKWTTIGRILLSLSKNPTREQEHIEDSRWGNNESRTSR